MVFTNILQLYVILYISHPSSHRTHLTTLILSHTFCHTLIWVCRKTMPTMIMYTIFFYWHRYNRFLALTMRFFVSTVASNSFKQDYQECSWQVPSGPEVQPGSVIPPATGPLSCTWLSYIILIITANSSSVHNRQDSDSKFYMRNVNSKTMDLIDFFLLP